VLNINFSAKTLSSQVQETVESRTDKRGKKYSPIGGKRLLTFIDDLNMPQVSLKLRGVSKYYVSLFPVSSVRN
jgi:dynein heavy chain